MEAPDYNVVTHLYKAAEQYPDRLAIVLQQQGESRSITFKQLWNKIDSFSAALIERSVRPGDRIVLMIPMSIELYIAMLGIIKAGGVAVFIDPWIGIKQIASFCSFASPKGFIGISKSHFLRLFRKELICLPLTVSTGSCLFGFPARWSFTSFLKHLGNGSIFKAAPDDPALITFTSGSSGVPKGANRTHGFLLAQYKALKTEFPYEPDDIDMPMFPVFALNNIAGMRTSVIPDMNFKNLAEVQPDIIYKQMVENNVTTATASPLFFDKLSAYLSAQNLKLPRLRRILTGGAPVQDDQLIKWRQCFGDTKVTIVYGSTEAEPVSHITLEKRMALSKQKKDSIKGYCTGTPASSIKAKVIKINKKPIIFQQNWKNYEVANEMDIGELIVTGDHVCRDYYNNHDAVISNKIIDADDVTWHRMGDTGYFDQSGMFWLTGRIHSTIIRDQKNYHAQLIEQTVSENFPVIEKVAAIGMSDLQLGETITIVINPGKNHLEPDLIKKQMTDLGYPIDSIIITTTKLPVDPRHNAKTDYGKLKRLILTKKIT
ncbi:MAG: AMP-binding protein [Desulfobacteraceae bacterium]|nr:AMP-binding protein [Desulfobacteraceae bacterium]